MRCSVNRLLQLATKPRLQSMRSDTSSQVWPSASSKISRARRASSARSVRLLARRVSSISSEFDSVMASLMDAIIVYKWLLQSTRCGVWYYICIVVMEVPVESAITVKGQATIPKAIREHLGLKAGDRVKFFVHPDGSVVLLPKLSASSLRGIIKSRRRRPVTIAEMTEAAVEGAARVARPTTRR